MKREQCGSYCPANVASVHNKIKEQARKESTCEDNRNAVSKRTQLDSFSIGSAEEWS